MSQARPALLVAIDTEGDNQWDLQARIHQRFDNIYALGTLHAGGAPRAVRGGLIRGDALALLALARRSRELASTPSYRGPARWTLGELLVDAG